MGFYQETSINYLIKLANSGKFFYYKASFDSGIRNLFLNSLKAENKLEFYLTTTGILIIVFID